VLINDHWVFPRRTEFGRNVKMNVEESRAAFEDSDQKRANLEFFRAELYRIRVWWLKKHRGAADSTRPAAAIRR
jgi:hypothetical protein